MSQNVAASLWEAAERWPDQAALILASDGRSVTFEELRVQAGAVAGGILDQGIEPGDRILVMLKPGLEFFATMFGLSAVGATGVLVDPGMGYRSMFQCLESIKPKAIIAEPVFHLLSWVFRTFDSGVFRVSRGWFPGCVSWRRFTEREPIDHPHRCEPEALAVLAFTSGSTGAPKPVVMDHGTLCAQIEAVRRMSGINAGQTQMAFIPLNALLGPGLGCTTVLPSVDSRRIDKLDPVKTIDEMNRYGVSHCLGSPFIWRRIVAELEATSDVSLPLDHLLVGGAPPDRDLITGLQRLSDARISIAYGATEAVPIATGSADEFLANLSGCLVGEPVPQMEAVVIVEDDKPRRAEPLEIGEVWIRGPLVSPGYDGFASTDHRRRFDGREWHPTGDCGYLNHGGRLALCGRRAHCVDTADGVLYPLLVEPVFEKHDGVSRAALVALDDSAPQRAALVVIPTGTHRQDVLSAELLDMAGREEWAAIEAVFFRREFPTDIRHRSKILRHELASWARGEMAKRLPVIQ